MNNMPLIHFINNYVTIQDVANMCNSIGIRPIMAEWPDELTDIEPNIDGLVINMGTISEERSLTIQRAVKLAGDYGKPILLDPVGCAASTKRLELAIKLLDTGYIRILKGNAKELMAILKREIIGGATGVDSDALCTEGIVNSLTAKYKTITISTGYDDIVCEKEKTSVVKGGHIRMSRLTGTGCMLNALIIKAFLEGIKMEKALLQNKKAGYHAAIKIPNGYDMLQFKQTYIKNVGQFSGRFYLITNEQLDFTQELLSKTEEALEAGISYLQYRAKNKSYDKMLYEAKILNELCKKFDVPLIINDYVELCKSVGAAGVHLGAEDEDIIEARKKLGPSAIIGATVKTVKQALNAEISGADYLGVGALFPSPTKTDAICITQEILVDIYDNIHIPIYGIGGITENNLSQIMVSHLDGVSVISAVYNSEDINATINNIKNCFKKGI